MNCEVETFHHCVSSSDGGEGSRKGTLHPSPPPPPRQSGLLGAVTERGTETGELGAGCVHSD